MTTDYRNRTTWVSLKDAIKDALYYLREDAAASDAEDAAEITALADNLEAAWNREGPALDYADPSLKE